MFLNLLGTTRPSYRGKQKRGGSVKLLWRPEPGRRRGNACLWMETNRLRLDYHRLRGFLSLKSLTGLSLSDTYTPSLLRATHPHPHTHTHTHTHAHSLRKQLFTCTNIHIIIQEVTVEHTLVLDIFTENNIFLYRTSL